MNRLGFFGEWWVPCVVDLVGSRIVEIRWVVVEFWWFLLISSTGVVVVVTSVDFVVSGTGRLYEPSAVNSFRVLEQGHRSGCAVFPLVTYWIRKGLCPWRSCSFCYIRNASGLSQHTGSQPSLELPCSAC